MNITLAIFSWIKDNWRVLLGSLLLVGSFLFGFVHSKSHWQKPLLVQIQKYEADQVKYNAKIDAISNQAKQDSKDLTNTINKANVTIDDLSSKYLIEKNKKQRVIYKVADPRDVSKSLDVEFNGKGDQICTRFSDTYLETLNNMIKEANK